MWLDGTEPCGALQMDGIAMPILLADQLHKAEDLTGFDAWPMILQTERSSLLDPDHKFRAGGKSAEEPWSKPAATFAPDCMPAIAAIAGILPLVLALGSGPQMLQVLTIAVIGGIVVPYFAGHHARCQGSSARRDAVQNFCFTDVERTRQALHGKEIASDFANT